MSERYSEALLDLRFLLQELEGEAQHTGYGFFPGGDPRDFTPDPECSTEEERALHKEFCDAWNRGERTQPKVPQCLRGDGSVGFGLGTYTMTDPTFEDWADRLRRALERLEAEG